MTLVAKSGATVYLVGTAHVSQTSVEVVRRAIREYQPQVVAVELCEARRAMLFPLPPQDLSVGGIVKSVMRKENNFFSVLYAYFLASVSDKLHVVPGAQFTYFTGTKVQITDADGAARNRISRGLRGGEAAAP